MPQNPTEYEVEIAERLAELHGHWYGQGPSKARAYVTTGTVVVVLEETFTKAEMKLIERDQQEGLREMRRKFQSILADEFMAIITQVTGQQVRSFVSDTDLAEHISIEVFILGSTMEDMSAYDGQTFEGEVND